jgi:hypothetical protein
VTPAGQEAVAAWLEESSDEPRVRDDFFMKLALAQVNDMADPVWLINKQRRHHHPHARHVSAGRASHEALTGSQTQSSRRLLDTLRAWFETTD